LKICGHHGICNVDLTDRLVAFVFLILSSCV